MSFDHMKIIEFELEDVNTHNATSIRNKHEAAVTTMETVEIRDLGTTFEGLLGEPLKLNDRKKDRVGYPITYGVQGNEFVATFKILDGADGEKQITLVLPPIALFFGVSGSTGPNKIFTEDAKKNRETLELINTQIDLITEAVSTIKEYKNSQSILDLSAVATKANKLLEFQDFLTFTVV